MVLPYLKGLISIKNHFLLFPGLFCILLYFHIRSITYTRVGYTQTRVHTRLAQGNVAYRE